MRFAEMDRRAQRRSAVRWATGWSAGRDSSLLVINRNPQQSAASARRKLVIIVKPSPNYFGKRRRDSAREFSRLGTASERWKLRELRLNDAS